MEWAQIINFLLLFIHFFFAFKPLANTIISWGVHKLYFDKKLLLD